MSEHDAIEGENGNGTNRHGASGISTPFQASLEPVSPNSLELKGPESLPSIPTGDRPPAGRDPVSGHFLPGNRLGRGSPLAGKAAKLRSALFRAVGTADLQAVIRTMIESAKGGDVAAAKVVLAYTLGDPVALDIVEKVERLEAIYVKTKG